VTGTLNGHRVRGKLAPRAGGYASSFGPTWCRDATVAVGAQVVVLLTPEGPQLIGMVEDIAAAATERWVRHEQCQHMCSSPRLPAVAEMDQLPDRADWPRLFELKRHWQVSIAALLIPARTLGRMSPLVPTYPR
jgi:hypothetical protein